MSNENYDYLFNIILAGDIGVGKQDFLLKYTDDSFTSGQFTVGK